MSSTAGMPSFSSLTRGLVSASRSVGRYSVRTEVLSAAHSPLAAMRVCSSPSSRRRLPVVLLLPNQELNLQHSKQIGQRSIRCNPNLKQSFDVQALPLAAMSAHSLPSSLHRWLICRMMG